jgi:hypothetical protein
MPYGLDWPAGSAGAASTASNASSFSYAFTPLVAFGAVGVLVVVLRWAYRRGGSLVPPPPRPGRPDEYGLLVSIAAPQTATQAEEAMERLEQGGVRVTLAGTSSGPRLMVFADDESRARALLAQPPV